MKMKVKEGFLLREVADSQVVVPVGKRTVDFNGMLMLNETGAFLWKLLLENTDENTLAIKLAEQFEVSIDLASKDVKLFVKKLKEANILE